MTTVFGSFRRGLRLMLSPIELIAVAGIIIVLIVGIAPMAVDIKSKTQATADSANEKTAAQILTADIESGKFDGFGGVAFFDPTSGAFTASPHGISPYGQCRVHGGSVICADFSGDEPMISWSDGSEVTAPDILDSGLRIPGVEMFGEVDADKVMRILDAAEKIMSEP